MVNRIRAYRWLPPFFPSIYSLHATNGTLLSDVVIAHRRTIISSPYLHWTIKRILNLLYISGFIQYGETAIRQEEELREEGQEAEEDEDAVAVVEGEERGQIDLLLPRRISMPRWRTTRRTSLRLRSVGRQSGSPKFGVYVRMERPRLRQGILLDTCPHCIYY
jgi:hypothetical protein